MSDFDPNEKQGRLIESTDGLHLVDAGAGTGKTFTVTRRYATIVEQSDVDPADILLVTFTNNAAAEMKERIVSQSGMAWGVDRRTHPDVPLAGKRSAGGTRPCRPDVPRYR